MSTFDLDEVKSFTAKRGGGNEACRSTWFGQLDSDDDVCPCEGDSLQVYKDFIERAFLNEEWLKTDHSSSREKKHKKEKKKKKKKKKKDKEVESADRFSDGDGDSAPTLLSGSEEDNFETMMAGANNGGGDAFDPFASDGDVNDGVQMGGGGGGVFDAFSGGGGGDGVFDPFDAFGDDSALGTVSKGSGDTGHDDGFFGSSSSSSSAIPALSSSSIKKTKKKKKKKSKEKDMDKSGGSSTANGGDDDLFGFDFGQSTLSTPSAPTAKPATQALSNGGAGDDDDLLDFLGGSGGSRVGAMAAGAQPALTSGDIMSQFNVDGRARMSAPGSGMINTGNGGGCRNSSIDPFAHLSAGDRSSSGMQQHGQPQQMILQQQQQCHQQQRIAMMQRQQQQRQLDNPLMIYTGNQGTMAGGPSTMMPAAAPSVLPRQSSQTKANIPSLKKPGDQFADLLNF